MLSENAKKTLGELARESARLAIYSPNRNMTCQPPTNEECLVTGGGCFVTLKTDGVIIVLMIHI